MLGYEEQRPWGSFFLQYLWEFCLGMWIAERMSQDFIHRISIWWLLVGAVGGMGLSAVMAWNGGILKLYNDIPSLMGYMAVMLLIYKLGMECVNKFFVWASSFSYELYLVHSLVFAIVAYCLKGFMPIYILLGISFIAAYVTGYAYRLLLKRFFC